MKNLSIKEGGRAKSFSANRIYVRQPGSNLLVPYVPLDTKTPLGSKSITKNGTYKASEDGKYAWDSVSVNIDRTKYVSGRGADGQEHVIRNDGDASSPLTDMIVPASIKVIKPPTFTGPYGYNANIMTSGMVVKAYKADGSVYVDSQYPNGVIPLSEITIDPMTAIYDPSKDFPTATSSLIDDMSFMKNPFPTGSPTSQFRYVNAGKDWTATITWETQGAEAITGAMTRFEPGPGYSLAINAIAASKSPLSIRYVEQTHDNKTGEDSTVYGQWSSLFTFTYAGKTVYYTNAGVISGYTYVTPCCANDVFYTNNTENVRKIAWTMIYGKVRESGYIIKVRWARPGDGAILEDDFCITCYDTRPAGRGED